MSTNKNPLCQPLLLPLSSPKKMAPFNNNMHYKTNFTIGIPSAPFSPPTTIYPPQQHKNETDLPLVEHKYIEQPKYNIPTNTNELRPEEDDSYQNVYKPSEEKVMIEESIGANPDKEHALMKNITNNGMQENLPQSPPPQNIVKIKEVPHSYERYASESKSASRASEEYPLHDYRKDPIGLFLPSQYEDAIQKQKEKKENYIKDLTLLKMRKMQEKQVCGLYRKRRERTS
jgi:hypothetical protein